MAYIVVADWNNTVLELTQAGWDRAMGGRFVQLEGESSCIGGRNIDFALVSHHLYPHARLEAEGGWHVENAFRLSVMH